MIGALDRLVRSVAGEPVASPVALPDGVEVRRSRWIPALGGTLARLDGPAAAVTLGRTILVHPRIRPTERLLRHELVHVEQWKRHPYAFPFRYTAAHIRHGYARNPYESEARAAEAAIGGPGEAG